MMWRALPFRSRNTLSPSQTASESRWKSSMTRWATTFLQHSKHAVPPLDMEREVGASLWIYVWIALLIRFSISFPGSVRSQDRLWQPYLSKKEQQLSQYLILLRDRQRCLWSRVHARESKLTWPGGPRSWLISLSERCRAWQIKGFDEISNL